MIIALTFMYNSYNVTRCKEISKTDDTVDSTNEQKELTRRRELHNQESTSRDEQLARKEMHPFLGSKSILPCEQQTKNVNDAKKVSTDVKELKELVKDDLRLFTDIRVILAHFAIMFSLMLRHDVTLTECCAELLLLYSSLNPLAYKKVYKDGHTHKGNTAINENDHDDDTNNDNDSNENRHKEMLDVITYTPHMRVRTLVPAYFCFTSLMLQVGFYYKWVVWISTNANWLFFAQLVFCSGIALFIILWYSEIVENYINTNSS